jgi:hypothetical protein
MKPISRHIAVVLLIAATATGCGQRVQTEPAPWSDDVQKGMVSAHSDATGHDGVPVQLVSMRGSRSAFTVELASEDGACRFTATGHDSNGAVTIDQMVQEQCAGQSHRSIKALIVPRNKPMQAERCDDLSDEKARLLCVVHVAGENRALALVVQA